ncbi:hypothetical protein PS3A_03390 [Pseudomonas sp. 3A(2025)]
MTKYKSHTKKQLSPYELLSMRVRKVISSPAAQATKAVLLVREDNDSPENWDRLFDEIEENENVTVTRRGSSAIHLSWTTSAEG